MPRVVPPAAAAVPGIISVFSKKGPTAGVGLEAGDPLGRLAVEHSGVR